MPKVPDPRLQTAVDMAISRRAPDFAKVYSVSGRRTRLRWSSLGLVSAAAVALVLVLTAPPPRPDFHHQISAFVELVYWE